MRLFDESGEVDRATAGTIAVDAYNAATRQPNAKLFPWHEVGVAVAEKALLEMAARPAAKHPIEVLFAAIKQAEKDGARHVTKGYRLDALQYHEIARHVREEAMELLAAVDGGHGSMSAMTDESGDVLRALSHLCVRRKLSPAALVEACAKKLLARFSLSDEVGGMLRSLCEPIDIVLPGPRDGCAAERKLERECFTCAELEELQEENARLKKQIERDANEIIRATNDCVAARKGQQNAIDENTRLRETAHNRMLAAADENIRLKQHIESQKVKIGDDTRNMEILRKRAAEAGEFGQRLHDAVLKAGCTIENNDTTKVTAVKLPERLHNLAAVYEQEKVAVERLGNMAASSEAVAGQGLLSWAADKIQQLQNIVATHDLCHNQHGKVGPQDFAAGCAAEQRKLYGFAPDADAARLRARSIASLEDKLKEAEARANLWADRCFKTGQANAELGIALVSAMVDAGVIQSPKEQITESAAERQMQIVDRSRLAEFLAVQGWTRAAEFAAAYAGGGIEAVAAICPRSELRADIETWESRQRPEQPEPGKAAV